MDSTRDGVSHEISTTRDGETADDPAVIRAEIRQTRAQLAETLNEIQERLSPAYLKEQATETIRDATVGKVEKMADSAEMKMRSWRSNVIHTVRQNPLPVAMIGVGLGWLMMSDDNGESEHGFDEAQRRSQAGLRTDRLGESQRMGWSQDYSRAEARVRPAAGEAVEEVRERAGEMVDQVQDRAEEMADRVQDRAGEMADRVQQTAEHVAEDVQERAGEIAAEVRERAGEIKERAGEVQQRASEAVTDVQQRAGEVVSTVQQRVGEATTQAETWARQTAGDVQHEAQMRARQAKDTFDGTLESNPFALGLVAVALGAAVGLLLPRTHREDEMMGQTRDRLLEDVKEQARDTAERLRHVAEEAGQAAKEEAAREAERQNLPTPDDLSPRGATGRSSMSMAATGTEETTDGPEWPAGTEI